MRLLLRGAGMAGLAAMIGGAAAVIVVLLPWHDLVTTVDMLGATSARVEARASALPGWQGAVSAAAGGVAVWLGAGVAFDRPVWWARVGLAAAAATLIAVAVAALIMTPDVATVAGPAHSIHQVADHLPSGVDLRLDVRGSVGPWVTLVAAGLILVGAATSRDT